MSERTSGRTPEDFSRFVARKLTGRLAEEGITGKQVARAINRSDAYVSARKNGAEAWNLDEIDIIGGMLGLDGFRLLGPIAREWDELNKSNVIQGTFGKSSHPSLSVDESELADERSVATPRPKKDVEGESEGETP